MVLNYIKNYIKGKIKVLMCFLIIVGIFFLCGMLYRQPLAAIIYPGIISSFLLIFFMAIDFFLSFKKVKLLSKIENSLDEIEDNLPMPFDGEEAIYQRICLKLNDLRKEEAKNHSDEISDMMDYYAVWVHQIKTPISSMKLQLEREDSAYHRKLLSELFRIEQYVEMVLVYLRMNSEDTDYVFKEYDVDRIVKNVIKKFSSDFIMRRIGLCCEPINYTAILDEKWFSFVLEQIISNSLKYTDRGQIKVYMEGDNLCIEDTGMGISKEDIGRVFEKGYTGYNGRIEKTSSGIGLYLCKVICENMSIDISMESEVSKGTKVILNLRRYQDRIKD